MDRIDAHFIGGVFHGETRAVHMQAPVLIGCKFSECGNWRIESGYEVVNVSDECRGERYDEGGITYMRCISHRKISLAHL